MSFIEKDLGFVQTRDQELSIALFKSIKLQLTRKLELILEYTPGEVAPRLKSWNLRSGMSSPKPGREVTL